MFYGTMRADSGQHPAIRRETEEPDRAGRPFEGQKLLASCDVPELDRPVGPCGCECFPIRCELQYSNTIRVGFGYILIHRHGKIISPPILDPTRLT